jgi:hemoglobin
MKQGLSILILLAACGPKKGPESPATIASAAPPAPQKSGAASPAEDKRSLYERLGGKPAITAVVEEFVTRNVTDPRVKFRFFNTDAARLKTLLVEFVCLATGGPCKYSGRDMKDSHSGMDLVDEEFTAVVENLKASMDKFHVGAREENEVLGALGPLKPEIVAPPDRFHPLDAQKLDAAEKVARTCKPEVQELLLAAIMAGRRGQRSYAEQLFSRAELMTGPDALAQLAPTFREGAPPRVTSALKVLPNNGPQPQTVGSSDDDEPQKEPLKESEKKPVRGALHGVLHLEGAQLGTMGVVMLEPLSGKWKRRAPKYRVLEQRERQFAPRIMAVPVGSTVAFPNFDGIFHNVFSLSKQKAFDLGIYRNGESREVTFDKEGIVQLGCNLHANMSAHLIVVAAPHYAVVGPNGKFYFRSLAPGRYRMKSWSDRSAEPVTTEIAIKAGTNDVSVDLKNDRALVNDDKFGVSRLGAAPRHASR